MATGRGSSAVLRLRMRAAQHTPGRVKELISRTTVRQGIARRLWALANGDLRHRDVTIRVGAGAGLRFNSADSVCGYTLGTAEPAVQEALGRELSPGMVVYDIGANIGFFTIIAARLVGSQGHVLAFEPVPENVRWLRHNIELNAFDQVDVVDAAVGSEERTVRIEQPGAGVWARISETGELSVPMVRLDDRIAAGSLPVPDLVKMDVEGAEIQVLAGMRTTLVNHRPALIVELHNTMTPVCEALRAVGYSVERIDPREPDTNGHLLARRADSQGAPSSESGSRDGRATESGAECTACSGAHRPRFGAS